MRYFLFLILFLSFASAGCTAEPKTEADASGGETVTTLAESIQPRTPGSSWEYISVYFDRGEAQSNGRNTEEVIRTLTLDGTECYLIKLTLDYRSLTDRLLGVKLTEEDFDYFWEYDNDKGSYNYWVEEADEVPKSLEDFDLTLLYPTEKGHRYRINDAETWTVLSVNQKLETPHGELNCVVYEVEYDELDGDDYITRERFYQSPGVGLVKWEMDIKDNGKWILDSRDTLYKFELKPAPQDTPQKKTKVEGKAADEPVKDKL